MFWTLFSAYYAALETLAAMLAVIILVSSADDLFIDLWYWGRRLYRALNKDRGRVALSPGQLGEKSEQPLAIMVPGWREHDVIAAMIENMVDVLEYKNYVVFI